MSATSGGPLASRLRPFTGYVAMVVAAVFLFLLIRARGETLRAPTGSIAPSVHAVREATPHLLFHLLLTLLVVIAVSRALGAALRHVQQPPVMGEMIAGLLLGPSLLGRLLPEVREFLLPDATASYLGVVAQGGVILFMFLVGLEFDTRLLRERPHATLAISHASIVVPFLLGSSLALGLYPILSTRDVSFTTFSLFMGVAMSVTAFPVLARILTDRQMQRSPLGVLALACAAVDDVTAWCLLAFIVGFERATSLSWVLTLGLTLAYVVVVLVVVRPVVHRLTARQDAAPELSRGATAAVFVALVASALVTEAIGIHALFGAFLLGAIIPHESRLAREMTRRLAEFVTVLLLPAFFAVTGMRTRIDLLSGATDWLLCGAILFVACAGKFGGSAIAARLSGLSWHDSASLGVLMNTRGLMELIVLNIGLELGAISPRLFAMLVIMAVVTTLATTPLLMLLERKAPRGAPA